MEYFVANAANMGNILVVAGSDSLGADAAANLQADLSGSNTVTVVTTGVPASVPAPVNWTRI